jgi:exodeoxyribonuclease VII small subunit
MAKESVNNQPSDQPTFEQSLKRLEEIVHALEEGELGLNEALERYEEGVKLLRQSYELLNRAERRIELLSGIDAEGNPITQPFDDTATFDAGQVARPKGDSPLFAETKIGTVPGNLYDDQNEPGKRRSRRRSALPPPGCGDSDP